MAIIVSVAMNNNLFSGISLRDSHSPNPALANSQNGEAAPSEYLKGSGVQTIPKPTGGEKPSVARWIATPPYNPASS